jgi:hypothetical protein
VGRFQVLESQAQRDLSLFYIYDDVIDDVVMAAGFDRREAYDVARFLNQKTFANLFLCDERFEGLQ